MQTRKNVFKQHGGALTRKVFKLELKNGNAQYPDITVEDETNNPNHPANASTFDEFFDNYSKNNATTTPLYLAVGVVENGGNKTVKLRTDGNVYSGENDLYGVLKPSSDKRNQADITQINDAVLLSPPPKPPRGNILNNNNNNSSNNNNINNANPTGAGQTGQQPGSQTGQQLGSPTGQQPSSITGQQPGSSIVNTPVVPSGASGDASGAVSNGKQTTLNNTNNSNSSNSNNSNNNSNSNVINNSNNSNNNSNSNMSNNSNSNGLTPYTSSRIVNQLKNKAQETRLKLASNAVPSDVPPDSTNLNNNNNSNNANPTDVSSVNKQKRLKPIALSALLGTTPGVQGSSTVVSNSSTSSVDNQNTNQSVSQIVVPSNTNTGNQPVDTNNASPTASPTDPQNVFGFASRTGGGQKRRSQKRRKNNRRRRTQRY